jgi:hypothetical protein
MTVRQPAAQHGATARIDEEVAPLSGARRMYLHVSRALFDLPPDRRPAALAALAASGGDRYRLPGAVTIGDSDQLPGAVAIGAEDRLPGGADDVRDGRRPHDC